jgi:hypothetical protein
MYSKLSLQVRPSTAVLDADGQTGLLPETQTQGEAHSWGDAYQSKEEKFYSEEKDLHSETSRRA